MNMLKCWPFSRRGQTAPISPPTASSPGYKEDDFMHCYRIQQFGKFTFVLHKESKERFFMKIQGKKKLERTEKIEIALNELNIMKKLDSPFIPRIVAAFQSPKALYTVMDVENGQTFKEYFHINLPMKAKHVTFYMAELFLGISYIHKRNIAHRNLRLESLLLTRKGHLKIFDFEMAKEGFKEDTVCHEICAQTDYLPPEAFLDEGYTRAIDWWGFGNMLIEMHAYWNIFDSITKEITIQKILRTKEKKIPFFGYMSEEGRDLMANLLTYEEWRLNEDQIRKHAFFSSTDWEEMELREIQPPIRKFWGYRDENIELNDYSPIYEVCKGAKDPFEEFSFNQN